MEEAAHLAASFAVVPVDVAAPEKPADAVVEEVVEEKAVIEELVAEDVVTEAVSAEDVAVEEVPTDIEIGKEV